MNSATDHFAAHVEDAEYHEPTSHGLEGEVHEHDEGIVDDVDSLPVAGGKRKFPNIPTPLLIVGAFVLFGVVGLGYKKLTAKPQATYVASAPQANGGGMIPAAPTSGEMQTGLQAQPSTLASPQDGLPGNTGNTTGPAPLGPTPMADHGTTMQQTGAVDGEARPQGVGTNPIDTGNVPGNNAENVSGAAVPATQNAGGDPGEQDAKDAEIIANLRAQIHALQDAASGSAAGRGAATESTSRHLRKHVHAALLATTDSADAASTTATSTGAASGDVSDAVATTSKPVGSHKLALRRGYGAHGAHGANSHRSVAQTGDKGTDAGLAHLHIKQVIPGQGWVEDESTGKQQVVSVGDHIGNARVTKIDPDSYRIETTAGVIQ